MKIKILNSGGYSGFKDTVVPFIVGGTRNLFNSNCVEVLGSELNLHTEGSFDPKFKYIFFIGDEAEIVYEG